RVFPDEHIGAVLFLFPGHLAQPGLGVLVEHIGSLSESRLAVSGLPRALLGKGRLASPLIGDHFSESRLAVAKIELDRCLRLLLGLLAFLQFHWRFTPR